MAGMFWGSFAGGLGQGLRQGMELQMQAKEHKLKSQMLKQQADRLEFETKKQQADLAQQEEAQRLNKALGESLQAEFTGGTPSVPGYEDPAARMSRAEVPAQAGPKQMDWRQRAMVGAAQQGKLPYAELFKQETKPQRPTHVAPGTMVWNQQTGAWEQIGTKEGERGLTAQEIQQLYGMDPDQASRISSLPPKTQERTLDNLRAQRGQEQSDVRFERTFTRLEQGRQADQARRDTEEQRRQERQQLEVDRRTNPPLSGKEKTDLANIRGGLKDIKRAREILTKAKGKFTGPIDTRTMELRNVFNAAPDEYNELTGILARLRNEVRHEKFGATLTGTELQEALRELVEERQNDAKVKSRLGYLEEQFQRNERALSEREQFWTSREGGGQRGGQPAPTRQGSLPPPPKGWK